MGVILRLILIIPLLVSCKSFDKVALSSLYPYERVNEKHPPEEIPEGLVQFDVEGIKAVSKLSGKDTIIIYLHGNGENIYSVVKSGLLERIGSLCDFIAIDYPGYGSSVGKPSEASLIMSTVYYAILAEMNNKKIVLMGYSLGGAVALQTAKYNIDLSTIILISTFSDLKTQIKELSPFGKHVSEEFYLTNSYKGQDVATQINVPVLILHGTKDTIVKPYHAKELEKRLLFSIHREIESGHNDIFSKPETFQYIQGFLKAQELCLDAT